MDTLNLSLIGAIVHVIVEIVIDNVVNPLSLLLVFLWGLIISPLVGFYFVMMDFMFPEKTVGTILFKSSMDVVLLGWLLPFMMDIFKVLTLIDIKSNVVDVGKKHFNNFVEINAHLIILGLLVFSFGHLLFVNEQMCYFLLTVVCAFVFPK